MPWPSEFCYRPLPLPPIHLRDIGTAGKGVPIGEVIQQILVPLLANITEAVANGAKDLGKDAASLINKEAGQKLDKAADSLKGLFKK